MESPFSWPCDVLQRILQFLANDGATSVFHQLAFVSHRNADLHACALRLPRPLVFHVCVPSPQNTPDKENYRFLIPFKLATVVQVKIDWGDGSSLTTVSRPGCGYVKHRYKQDGTFCVRIFPHGPGISLEGNRVWLDHLGWDTKRSYFPREAYCNRWCRLLHSFEAWGTLGCRSLRGLFSQSRSFNLPLPAWGPNSVVDIGHMFHGADSFNQPVSHWRVGGVRNMEHMFHGARCFNQPLGSWNVSSVGSMESMFELAVSFNQPIGGWAVCGVENMISVFAHARSFNQPIGEWDVRNVTSMRAMFFGATKFNQPVGDWNLDRLTCLSATFCGAVSFNQPLGKWNLSNVEDIGQMFCGAKSFNQLVSGWDVRRVIRCYNAFEGTPNFDIKSVENWNFSNAGLALQLRPS